MAEQCEYDPAARRARYDGEGCTNEATVRVGANGKWHLCVSCAARPEFSKYRSRGPLPPLKGLFSQLTPEQRRVALGYRGNDA